MQSTPARSWTQESKQGWMCGCERLYVSNPQVHRLAPDGEESISPGPQRQRERQKEGSGKAVSNANALPCSSQKLSPVATLVRYSTLRVHSKDTPTNHRLQNHMDPRNHSAVSWRKVSPLSAMKPNQWIHRDWVSYLIFQHLACIVQGFRMNSGFVHKQQP